MFYFDEAESIRKIGHSNKETVVKSCGNQLKVTGGKVVKNRPIITPPVNPSISFFSFTSYEKCDSLLQFPRMFVACLNSGDYDSLGKLLRSRTDRNCEVNYIGKLMDPMTFVKVFQLANEMYPDCVCHSPRAVSVGNQISTSLFFKYTASKTIEQSLKARDPALFKLCPSLHTDPARLNDFIASRPVEDRPALLTSVYTAEELIVHGRTLFTVTFEDCSRKITRMDLDCDYSTFEAV